MLKESGGGRAIYFAYGSNMNDRQMKERCPSAARLGIGHLPNHALCFAGYSACWGGAVASVTPRKDDRASGVLYTLDRDDMIALDGFEGHPFVYVRVLRDIVQRNGARIRAHVYIHREQFRVEPSPAYLSVLRNAYRLHGFDSHKLLHAAWGLT